MAKGNTSFIPGTLAFRIIVTFILLSVFITGGFGLVFYFLTFNGIKQVSVRRLEELNALKKQMLLEWVDEKERETALLASFATVLWDSGSRDDLNTVFEKAAADSRDIEDLYLYSLEEEEIFASPFSNSERIPPPYRFQTLKEIRQSRVTPFYFTVSRNEPAVTVTVPLENEGRKLPAVLIAHWNITSLPGILSLEDETNSSEKTYIAVKDGMFISEDKVFREIPAHFDSPLMQSAFDYTKSTKHYRDGENSKKIGTSLRIPGFNAALITEASRREVFSAGSKALVWIAGGVVLSVLVFFGTGIVIASSVTEPLTELSRQADGITAGNIDQKLPVKGSKETQVLAETFNKMLERINVLYRRISRSERHFRGLIERGTEAVAIIRWNGIIEYVSSPIQSILGYLPENLQGKSIYNFTKEETKHQIQEDLMSLERKRFMENKMVSLRNNDGDSKLMEVSGSLFKLDDGTPRIALTIRDISKKLKADFEFQRINRISALSEMAGKISNDFNNILTGVIGNLSLIKLSLKEDDDSFSRIEGAIQGINRAKELTQKLLSFSNGKIMNKKMVSPEVILDRAVDLHKDSSEITFTRRYSDELWLLYIDLEVMVQAISDIIKNSINRMPEGGDISVEGRNILLHKGDVPTLKAGPYVRIAVSDDGGIIPEEELHMIFDPSFSSTELDPGLGLSLSYVGVKKHNGHITVESGEKTGTVFAVYLPGLIYEEGSISD